MKVNHLTPRTSIGITLPHLQWVLECMLTREYAYYNVYCTALDWFLLFKVVSL